MPSVSSTQSVTIRLPRDELFEWWVPIDLPDILHGYGPLPGVERTSDQTGPWHEVGSRRTVHLADGHTAREEVVACESPRFFAYEVGDFTNAFRFLVAKGRGEWQFEPDGSVTDVTWTYTFWPTTTAAMPLLVPIVKLLWSGYMRRGIEATRDLAEREIG